MIQYSSINDAWGNKKPLNYVENFVAKDNKVPVQVPMQIPVPELHNKKDVHPEPPVIKEPPKKETFANEMSPCAFTEHLKTCEKCKNTIAEYFENNDNPEREINFFGLVRFHVTTEFLKGVFVVIIIVIFVLLLSMINISFKNNNNQLKYYMVPANIPHQYFNH